MLWTSTKQHIKYTYYIYITKKKGCLHALSFHEEIGIKKHIWLISVIKDIWGTGASQNPHIHTVTIG